MPMPSARIVLSRGTVMETKIPPDKIVEPGIREFSEKDAETLRNAFN